MADTQAEIKVALESLNKSVEGLRTNNQNMSSTLISILGVMADQTAFMKGEAAEDEFKDDVKKTDKSDEKSQKANDQSVKVSKEEGKKTKGFLSKIGGLFAGAGMGAAATIGAIGLAAAGIALVVMSITKLIEVMSTLDAGMIKDKVVTLLSIAGEIEKDGKSFIGEGAKFFLAMVGIGLGLLVFGLGAGVAGLTIRLVQAGFADKVLQIVSKLMEIPDELGGVEKALKDGGTFLAVMLGIGIGLLVFGVGQAVASLTIRLAKQGFAQKVVDIVTTLMKIPDALGGHVEALKDGGVFLAVMLGIGIGLLVFGAGLAVAALVVTLTNDEFAQKTLNLVTKLMEIPKALGSAEEALAGGGVFLAVMLGIGAGLLVFGGGLAVAGLVTELVNDGFAQNVVDTVAKLLEVNTLVDGVGGALKEGMAFTTLMLGLAIGLYIFAAGAVAGKIGTLVGGDFAQNVVDTIAKLLEVNALVGSTIGGALTEGGTFFITMLAIAAGLYIFAIGSIATGIGNLIAGDFAQGTVDTVTTLLSIAKLPMADTGLFLATMAGIAVGLLIFSIGEAAGGIASFIGSAGTGGKGVAESIKEKIDILMEVARNVKMADVTNLQEVLTGMRQAIKNFTGGLGGALAEGAGNVVGWLTGANRNDPMTKILEFARSADELERGTTALERLGSALNNLSGSRNNNNLQQFANNLESISQTIRTALDKMLWGGGMGAERTRALEALAAVNLGSEGLAAMRDANAVAPPPSIVNSNNMTTVESTGGTTNVFNGGGSIDPSMLAALDTS